MSPWLHFANSLLHAWNKAGSTQRHPLMPQSRRTAISHSEPRLQFKTGICPRKRTFIWTSRLQRYGNAFVLNKHSRWWFSIYMEKYYSAGYFLYQNVSVIEFYLPFEMTILFFTLWINFMLFAGEKGWFSQWRHLFCWRFHSSSRSSELRFLTGAHVQNQMFNQASVSNRYKVFVNA